MKLTIVGCIVAMVGLVAVSACSQPTDDAGSGGGTNQAGRDALVPENADAAGLAAPEASAERESAGKRPAPLLTDRDQIKTASISLEAKNLDPVLLDIDSIVTAHRGLVDSEDTRTNKSGVPVQARLVLRVPVAQFDATVDEVSALGTLLRQQTFTEDVTTEVADVDSRVASAERSIRQLRRLFRAATDLGDIIDLEAQLSRRQADLESLQAQQRSLADQTDLSTITVRVSRATEPATEPEEEDRGGFVGGIKQGWDGLVSFLAALSHGAGLVLPIGLFVAACLAALWVVVRRLSPRVGTRTSE